MSNGTTKPGSDGLNGIVPALLSNLPIQFALMLLVLIVTGWLVLKPEGQPPSIPQARVWSFILIAALIVLVAAGLWLLERRLVVQTARAIEAEAAARTQLAEQREDELRRLQGFVQKLGGHPGSERDVWTRTIPRLPLHQGV